MDRGIGRGWVGASTPGRNDLHTIIWSNAKRFRHVAVGVNRRVQNGTKQMAFILHGMVLQSFEAIVRDSQRLPAKSTCFFPKLPTGLIINPLDA